MTRLGHQMTFYLQLCTDPDTNTYTYSILDPSHQPILTHRVQHQLTVLKQNRSFVPPFHTRTYHRRQLEPKILWMTAPYISLCNLSLLNIEHPEVCSSSPSLMQTYPTYWQRQRCMPGPKSLGPTSSNELFCRGNQSLHVCHFLFVQSRSRLCPVFLLHPHSFGPSFTGLE